MINVYGCFLTLVLSFGWLVFGGSGGGLSGGSSRNPPTFGSGLTFVSSTCSPMLLLFSLLLLMELLVVFSSLTPAFLAETSLFSSTAGDASLLKEESSGASLFKEESGATSLLKEESATASLLKEETSGAASLLKEGSGAASLLKESLLTISLGAGFGVRGGGFGLGGVASAPTLVTGVTRATGLPAAFVRKGN